MLAEFWGRHALALYLFVATIDSVATALVFVLFMHIIHGGLAWLFNASLLRRATVLHSGDTDAIVRRVMRFVGLVICGLILLPATLMFYGIYDNLGEATTGLLGLGINLGSQRISLSLIIAFVGVLYGSFLASWILQKALIDQVLLRRQVTLGVRHAIGRLIHYAVMFIGFVFACVTLGINFTQFTIILSGLGVGIGFGLQGIVNNFVSGLILLFERPVRVGDTIELAGQWADIKKIGLRATTVKTLEDADVIIPNAELVNSQVTNWTLSNRRVRLTVRVGVAYGSDVPRVVESLQASAADNKNVLSFPAPQALFLAFGESSLDFELRVWVSDADHRLSTKSELHQDIDRRFQEANIEIAFPQRDLHLRSMDESIASGLSQSRG
jgi:small-conductance mechanosensitive channel